MASQMKIIVALLFVAAIVAVSAQDYDDEGGNQGGNDGYGDFSGGGSSDDDYAAPRGPVGAEGSEAYPGYHQNDEAGYDNDDTAAAASHGRPSVVRRVS